MDANPSNKRWLKTWLLALDGMGLVLVYVLAYSLRFKSFDPQLALSRSVLTYACINFFFLYLLDLYQLDPQTPLWKKPFQAMTAVFVAACTIVLEAYLSGAIEFSGLRGRGVLLGAQLSFGVWAAMIRFCMSKWLRRVTKKSRWLVLASEEYLKNFARDLAASRLAGHFAFLTPDGVGSDCIPPNLSSPSGPDLSFSHLGKWNDFEQLSNQNWAGIVACGAGFPDKLIEQLMDIRLRGVRVIDLTDFYEQTWSKVPVFYLQRSWFAMAHGFQLLHNPIGLRAKRILDILGSGFLLMLTSPVILLSMALIKLESPGPVIFKQTRVGENGRNFLVYKLRSMRNDAEKDGAQWATINDSRVTHIGSFLRMTRIDELPQLLCVIKGNMSFIGPRPERPEFTGTLNDEIPFYNLRHILRPGVTGWAQVMYPYGASVDDAREKLQYDLYYIKNYSLLLDAAIVMKTIRVVLFGKGR